MRKGVYSGLISCAGSFYLLKIVSYQKVESLCKTIAQVSVLLAKMVASLNRPDEWKIEQGFAGAKLPILDQTGTQTATIEPQPWEELTKDEEAIKAVGDPDLLFTRELEGWKGYVII